MKRRIPIILLLVAAIKVSCTKQKKQSDSQSLSKPNIVFFLVDDLGWSDVGSYGSNFYETPNIDKLADQGVKFTDAYAACHVCSPTRASILTGKYPATLKLTDVHGHVIKDIIDS